MFLDQEKVVQELAGVDEKMAQECVTKSKNDLVHAILHAELGDQAKSPDVNVDIPEEKNSVLDYEDFNVWLHSIFR